MNLDNLAFCEFFLQRLLGFEFKEFKYFLNTYKYKIYTVYKNKIKVKAKIKGRSDG